MKSKKTEVLIALITTLTFSACTGEYFLWMYRLIPLMDTSLCDLHLECFEYLCQIPGLIAVAIMIKRNKNIVDSLYLYPTVTVLSLILSAVVSYGKTLPVIISFGLIRAFLNGIQQGFFFYIISRYVSPTNRCLIFGISYALSSVLTGFISLISKGNFAKSHASNLLYLLLFSIAYFALILLKKEKDILATNVTLPEAGLHTLDKKNIIITSVVIFFMWTTLTAGYHYPLDIPLSFSYSAEVLRIPYAIGLIIAGIANARDKKLGASLCLLCLAYPFFALLLNKSGFTAVLLYATSHIFTAFFTMYRFSIFSSMSHSVDSKGNPMTYLVVFGLIFGRLGEAVGSFTGILLSDNKLLLTAIESFFLVVCILFYVEHYVSSFSPAPEVIKSHEEKARSFKTDYGLSKRELDVLNLLLENKTNGEIADSLFVSENTVRFHMSNILKKTGMASRNQVIDLFNKS